MTETQDCDFLIIGGGIAGASAGYALAGHGRVVILERESQPGYHSTGRSAALFTENYGAPAIRALAKASRPFLESPPDGFADAPLLTPRGTMLIARDDQRAALEAAHAEGHAVNPDIRVIGVEEARTLCPVIDPDYVAGAVYEPDAKDMDVHAIHHGYLRGARGAGGTLVNDAEVVGLGRVNGSWVAETTKGAWRAPAVLNAAGAWADEIARMAGVEAIGLVPKRRTAMIFDPPAGEDCRSWVSVIDVDEQFYFKPDAGKLLGSPADETPVPPQDIQPEEIDIAHAVDRIERASTLEIKRVERRWAGLRSFVEDKTIVAGRAPDADGFIWVAGQGGYGIMTSHAVGRIAAAAAADLPFPTDIEDCGLAPAALSPERLTTKPKR